MNRRAFLKASPGAALLLFASDSLASQFAGRVGHFEFDEVTIAELLERIRSRRLSAAHLCKRYLHRIHQIDRNGPKLNSILELNPDALAIAEKVDRDLKKGTQTGPLHGIPVLVKDNIDTGDKMSTSAGSLALANSHRPQDAPLVAKLRAAGAVILGKTNLSEWANFRGYHSSSGWSARGGQTHNPYALNRNPSGSSSGSGVAVSANLCAAAIGTETDGSILSPSSYNGIVGVKPTVGLVSQKGIIPISKSQDTAGPMARTVADAAAVLSVIGEKGIDYTKLLSPDGLKGARIGVARKLWSDNRLDEIFATALRAMKEAGAELIDPIELQRAKEFGDAEGKVLQYEFKDGLNSYLRNLDPALPVHSLEELIAFNEQHRKEELPWFGQEELIESQKLGPLTDQAYLEAKETCRKFGANALDTALSKDKLDAIIAPTSSPAHVTDHLLGDRGYLYTPPMAAIAGYPSITVPMGFMQGLPVGISFFSGAWQEETILKIAHAYERRTKARRPPAFLAEL